jgi:hypothetical protein
MMTPAARRAITFGSGGRKATVTDPPNPEA